MVVVVGAAVGAVEAVGGDVDGVVDVEGTVAGVVGTRPTERNTSCCVPARPGGGDMCACVVCVGRCVPGVCVLVSVYQCTCGYGERTHSGWFGAGGRCLRLGYCVVRFAAAWVQL